MVLIVPSRNEDDGDDKDIIYVNEKGTCTLIYVAVSWDRNVIKKEDEILKYKELTIELQRMWKAKTFDTRWQQVQLETFQNQKYVCEFFFSIITTQTLQTFRKQSTWRRTQNAVEESWLHAMMNGGARGPQENISGLTC